MTPDFDEFDGVVRGVIASLVIIALAGAAILLWPAWRPLTAPARPAIERAFDRALP